MKTITGEWMEVDVRYRKTMEDGEEKAVTERYVVDAMSFTEGEASAIEEVKQYVSGDLKVKKMNPAAYREVMFSEDSEDEGWYKVRIAELDMQDNGKLKRIPVNYLVQAGTLQRAVNNVMAVMGNTMIDYVFVSVVETKIVDAFEHKKKD